MREVERRIQRVEAQNASGEARELPEAPIGVPDSFDEHVKLMLDLQVLAFATDVTRVFSFKMGRDGSARVYPDSGVRSAFHPASHHGEREDRILEFNKICKYRVSQVTYLLDRLKESVDGDKTLLDKTMVVWGSPMADPNVHNHRRCPLIVLGHGNGALKGNMHIKAPADTPMANAFLTKGHMLGMEEMKTFGDSTGELSLTQASPATVA